MSLYINSENNKNIEKTQKPLFSWSNKKKYVDQILTVLKLNQLKQRLYFLSNGFYSTKGKKICKKNKVKLTAVKA